MEYLIILLIMALGGACWAIFQLWLGKQPDGTDLNADRRDCHHCGDNT